MPSGYDRYINQYSFLLRLIRDYLKRQHHNNNLSVKKLAKLMNLSQQQISRYERGMTYFNMKTLLHFLCLKYTDSRCFIELVTAWYKEKSPH